MEPVIFKKLRTEKPNPKQEEFFKATAAHIAYGGARGGGKSWAMRRKFVLLAMRYSGLKLLLLRRTLKELRENHVIPLQAELYRYAMYKDKESAMIFPNGSRLVFGYCAAESDIYQFQGQEYDVIGMEEATHFTEAQKDFITTCNRSIREDFAPRMYYTSNPGNVGHEWFKRLFIDRDFKESEVQDEYIFIPAKVYDNKVLMKSNPQYVKILENLPEDLRKAHLDGDWDAFAGQYFPEFKRDIHVLEAFVIPKEWKLYRALDYGLDMLACYWIAVDYLNNCYVYREVYQSNLIISEAAKAIKEATICDEQIDETFAPPDLWNKRQETGASAAEIFYTSGLTLTKAKNDRVQGWYALKEYLAIVPNEKGEMKPKLFFFKNCTNLIRCIPQLQHSQRNPNDTATEPHEITHAPDAIRYFIAGRPKPARMNTAQPVMNFKSEQQPRNPAGKGGKVRIV